MSIVTRQDQMANVRKQVARQAAQGTRPSIGEYSDLLEEAYPEGAGLAKLEEQAIQVQKGTASSSRRSAERRVLESMVRTVKREWDEQARLEQNALATAEAKKRLGIS